MPPNEIHLSLTSDGSGTAQVTVENAHIADERARSVVVHAAAGDAPSWCAPIWATSGDCRFW